MGVLPNSVQKFYEELENEAMRFLQKRGYRWDTRGEDWELHGFNGENLLHWKLWEAVENLDIQYYYVKELLRKAKTKKIKEAIKPLQRVLKQYDEILKTLDPWDWTERRKSFRTIDLKKEKLERVLEKLERIKETISKNKLLLAKVEFPKDGGTYLTYVFMLYTDIMDNVYGIKKWLSEMAKFGAES